MRTRIVMLMLVLAGCGSVRDKGSDASVPNVSMPSGSSICKPTGTFDTPVLLTGLNTAAHESLPRLTADELELYFSLDPGTGDSTIYRAQRRTTSEPFAAPIALVQLSTPAQENNPSVSSDGLMLFFESSRVSGEGYHLYVSTRASRVGEFVAPSEVANVNSATVTDSDSQAFVTADTQELWFVSSRPGGLGNADIYRAAWSGSGFANVAAITALSSDAADYVPTLSADKLTVYLSSNRPSGKGNMHIWTAHRSTTRDGFPAPTPVRELNSSGSEFVGWLSPDNCRLYFSSDAAGTLDITSRLVTRCDHVRCRPRWQDIFHEDSLHVMGSRLWRHGDRDVIRSSMLSPELRSSYLWTKRRVPGRAEVQSTGDLRREWRI
jgi:hypothetical protein